MGFSECFGRMRKRTQTTQTRACRPQQRVALAYGELLPQPRLSVASSLYQKRPQSGCGSSPPSGGSDWAQQPARAEGSSQEQVRRTGDEGCVCVGRERARAMSKPERLATLCSFPHAFKALAKNQHQTHGVCYLRFFKICLELLEIHSYSI